MEKLLTEALGVASQIVRGNISAIFAIITIRGQKCNKHSGTFYSEVSLVGIAAVSNVS